MKPTLLRWDDLEWGPMPRHPGLFHKEILSKEEWEKIGLRIWKVLIEKIEPGGAVLPHYHDVAEIIHFLEEEVSVIMGEERTICHPGDSLVVPAGIVHSVANKGERDSKQISFFLPHIGKEDYGHTELVEEIEI
ncbi:MAG: cupin domain-containing protein [Nitrospinota bacterium]|mgnify:FL=1|jgi:uncharacterized cupin superfamily protein